MAFWDSWEKCGALWASFRKYRICGTSNVSPKSEAKTSGWLQSAVAKIGITSCDAFSLSSVVSPTFCAICMYSKFGHHPHPLGYLCAKFCFFCGGLHCWGSPRRKIAWSVTHPDLAYSIAQLIGCPGNQGFHLGKYTTWLRHFGERKWGIMGQFPEI